MLIVKVKSTVNCSNNAGRVLIIGGVSGSGKSTVGKALAGRLGWRFIEGDAFHSEANISKMRKGEPLDDSDRESWLSDLRNEIKKYLDRNGSAVLACSALKESYRGMLRDYSKRVHFVLLIGGREVLHQRLKTRRNHFLGAKLLASQLAALELSDDMLLVNIEQPVETIVGSIVDWLTLLDNAG